MTVRLRRLPAPLLLNLSITVLLSILSWIVALINHIRGLPKPYSWPYYMLAESPQNPHGDRFGDLTSYIQRFHHFGKLDFFAEQYGPQFLYPSPMALFYRMFLPTFAHPVPAFFAFLVLTMSVAATMLIVQMVRNGLSRGLAISFITASALFSHVLAFEFQRCNLEVIPFIFIACSIYLLTMHRPQLAGIVLGGAVALKFYPVILLGLFLARREYRATIWALLSVAFWFLLGFTTETRSISESLRGTSQGLRLFSRDYAEQMHLALGWDHSAFSLVKTTVYLHGSSIPHALHLYVPLAGLAAFLCYFLRIKKLPFFNQVTTLCIFCVLLPPVSFEYTLMQLFPAFALFCCMAVRQHHRQEVLVKLNVLGLCFGLLFSLMGFAIIHNHMIEGQIKSLILFCLLAYLLWTPIDDPVLDGDLVALRT